MSPWHWPGVAHHRHHAVAMSWRWYCGRLILVVLWPPCCPRGWHCVAVALAMCDLLLSSSGYGHVVIIVAMVVLVVLAASLLSLLWCCGNHLVINIMLPWHLPCASHCHRHAGVATSSSSWTCGHVVVVACVVMDVMSLCNGHVCIVNICAMLAWLCCHCCCCHRGGAGHLIVFVTASQCA